MPLLRQLGLRDWRNRHRPRSGGHSQRQQCGRRRRLGYGDWTFRSRGWQPGQCCWKRNCRGGWTDVDGDAVVDANEITSASGFRSTAIGAAAQATSGNSAAFGEQARAIGINSTALGNEALASQTNTIAVGRQSQSTSGGAISMGFTSQATGPAAVAIGTGTTSTALGTVALGSSADATALSAIAIGASNTASGENSIAIGAASTATLFGSIALGQSADAIAANAVALGANSQATESNTVSLGAIGAERRLTNVAAGTAATNAVNVGQLQSAGFTLDASGIVTTPAVTYSDAARGQVILGGTGGTVISNVAPGTAASDAVNLNQLNTAIGGVVANASPYFRASGPANGADNAITTGADAVAAGRLSQASGDNSTAVGANSLAAGLDDTALGGNARVNAAQGTAVGGNSAIASGATGATALGASANVGAANGVALGSGSSVTAASAVAIGAASIADQVGTVSVGSAGAERRIVNVASGTSATDAVNVSQLQLVAGVASDALLWDSTQSAFSATHLGSGPNRIINLSPGQLGPGSLEAVNGGQLFGSAASIAAILGGGAALNPDGTLSTPSYTFGGSVFGNVNEVLTDLYNRISVRRAPSSPSADPRFVADGAPPAGVSSATASVAAGSGAQANAANSVAVGANSIADRADSVSVGSVGNERQVTNVAAGTTTTDAANVGQLNESATSTLTQATNYTDQRVNQVIALPIAEIERLRGEIDDRFRTTDRRINRHGAMTGAMVQMASSAANIQTRNRLSVGAGYSEGEQALAVGYQRLLQRNVSLSVGAAFSGSEQSAGVGLGVGW